MLHNFFLRFLFSRYLERGETIHYIGHKHVFYLIREAWLFFFLGFFVPWYLYLSNGDLLFISWGLLIFFGLRFSMQFFSWLYDCWIITNKGIIDIYWNGIFKRKVIRIGYHTFEGISVSVGGFWDTIFRKGKIEIVKAVDNNEMALHHAYRPQKIEREILKAKEKHEEEHPILPKEERSHEETVKELLTEIITKYAEAKGVRIGKEE